MKLPVLPKNIRTHKKPVETSRYERNLTPREQEIVKLLLEDLSHARIAQQLGISPGTVGKHVMAIKQKLELEGTARVALKAWNGNHGSDSISLSRQASPPTRQNVTSTPNLSQGHDA